LQREQVQGISRCRAPVMAHVGRINNLLLLASQQERQCEAAHFGHETSRQDTVAKMESGNSKLGSIWY